MVKQKKVIGAPKNDLFIPTSGSHFMGSVEIHKQFIMVEIPGFDLPNQFCTVA
jgi:hypothetical protein